MTDQSTASSPRHDGWTPARQRTFLESLATLGLVRRAAKTAGMSHEAAYQLRHRQDGAAFRLGWDAALLLARTPLADLLMERAIEGQEDVTVRDDDGRTRTKTRHDNRLALSLLSRLDRFADDNHDAHADARIVAGTWDAFLDLVETGADAAALDAFLDTRRPSAANPDRSFEPCQLCGETDDAEDIDEWLHQAYQVWWSDTHGMYRTNFPPPPQFSGDQKGNPDDGPGYRCTYERDLSPLEVERHIQQETADADDFRARSHKVRKEWFGIEDWEEAEAPCSDAPVAVS